MAQLDILGQIGLRTISMKISLSNWLKKRNNTQSFYIRSKYTNIEKLEKKYPLFISMIDSGVYAYTSRFMIKNMDINLVKEVIKREFEGDLNYDKGCLENPEQRLDYCFFTDMDEIVVEVITNSVSLIEAIHRLKLTPPSPQTVFPDVDFGAIGSLQGKIEYWWNVYWFPFWSAIDSVEKLNYIDNEKLSEDVIEFIQLHE